MGKKKEKTKKNKGIRITDLIIPLVSGLILLILLFFSFIPMLQEANETIENTRQVKIKQREMQDKISMVQSIDYLELQNDLVRARRVVPNSLEVTEYAYYVDNLAQQKDLEFIGIKAEDQFSPHLGEVKGIQGVEAPLQYRGAFDNVATFFNELQAFAPYIISMGDIEFSKNTEMEDEWTFEITVTGYYFPDEAVPANMSTLISQPFFPYNQNNDEMVGIFRDKAAKLESR